MKITNFNMYSNINVNFNKLSFLLILVFIFLRLYSLQFPSPEKAAWKEIDYIQISKNYLKNDVQFWEPTISWPAEAPRITAMEFPLVPYVASRLYKLFGFNVYTLRIITLVSFILLSLYLYKIVALQTKEKSIAFLTLLLSLIIPLNLDWGRFLFSDPAILASIIISIYHLLKWKINDNNRNFYYAFIFFALAILLKPTAMYAALPLLYLYYSKVGNLKPKNYYRFGVALFIAIIPAILWYAYAYHLTRVSIDVFGVFGGHNKFQTIAMLSDPGWWKMMLSRFSILFGGSYSWLGLIMLTIFFIGLLSGVYEKKFRLFYFLFLSNLAFLFIVAEGNWDTNYRQYAFIASGSFFIASGFLFIGSIIYIFWEKISASLPAFPNANSKLLYWAMVLVILTIYSYNFFIQYPPRKDTVMHPEMHEIAKKVNDIKTKNSKLVTTGNYTVHKGGNGLCPILYYYTDLQGWSLEEDDWKLKKIENLKAKGADIFVGMNILTDEASHFNDKISKKYPIIYKSEEYVICDLTETNN